VHIYIYLSTRKELLKEDASIIENIRKKYSNIFHDSRARGFFFSAWKNEVWEGYMPVGPEGMNQSTMEVLGDMTCEYPAWYTFT
jgi:hypothetical protein